ncbi:MAG: hypothetical protein V7459_13460 [Oceanicoccus sp.]
MPIPIKLLFSIALILCLAACGTTATIGDSWVKPDFKDKDLNGVLVVAVSHDETMRTEFEQAYTKALQEQGINAVSSYTLAAGATKKEDVIAAANAAQLDTILVTRYAGTFEQPVFYQGRSYYARTPAYGGGYHGRFGGYYTQITKVYSQPDVWMNNKYVTLVSDLYEVATEDHLWQASSSSLNPENMDKLRDAFITSFVKQMDEQKMLER